MLKGTVGALTVIVVVLAAAPAQATIFQKTTYDGYDCAGDMTTTNCFGPTISGPTATACTAAGRNNQRCRDCMEAYNSAGEPMGYNTCNYVRRSASCDCYPSGRPDCVTNVASTCTYYW